MIKNNRGVTLSVLVVTIIVIMILAGVTITTSDLLIKDTKAKSVVSNMYLVKGKAETLYEDYQFSTAGVLPDSSATLGQKVDVSTLTTYGVTSTGDTEVDSTWYRWGKSVLEANGLEPGMLGGTSEFIVNYATGDVIYTAGIRDDSGTVKYKLSQFTN